jgi:hypothetical protein
VVEGAVVGACRGSYSADQVTGGGVTDADPEVSATAGGRLTHKMRDRKTAEDLRERLAVVDGTLCSIVSVFGVEVEAQEAELSTSVGEADAPGRGGNRGAEAVEAGVLVGVELSVGFADHHADFIARANASGEFPRRFQR